MGKLIKNCHFLLLYVLWILSCFSKKALSSATDAFSSNQPLSDGKILTSAGGTFNLGFFTPGNSSSGSRYLGIWYNHPGPDRVIVWVANRDHPVPDASGMLKIDAASGNLVLVDRRNRTLWSTSISSNPVASAPTARIMDYGELVLSQADATILWSSSDQLTDTLLPKAELSFDRSTNRSNTLTSWKSNSDPSAGSYTLSILSSAFDQGFVLIDGSKPYWRMGPWIGQKFIGIPDMAAAYWNGFSLNRGDNKITFRYALYNDSNAITSLVLDPGGRLLDWWWDRTKNEWALIFQKPEHQCDLYGTCGEFALCNSSSSPICSCMRGFQPRSIEDWARGNWSGGCARVKQLECLKNQSASSTTASDGFFKLERLKLPDFASWYNAVNETDCRLFCSKECSCLAYAYVGGNCMLWSKGLLDTMTFQGVGEDLNVKLNPSELDQAIEGDSSTT